MKCIETLDDIRTMVDSFYQKVRVDAMIGGVFNGVIKDRWPEHLEKMHRFWQTILLNEPTYHGSPFQPHAHLPIQRDHFMRWVELFCATVDEHFTGEKAETAKALSRRMAEAFSSKIAYLKDQELGGTNDRLPDAQG